MAVVALHVLTLVVMDACGRPARRGDLKRVAQFVTVERRIAPPPVVPERSVPVSEHSAPQCPDAGHQPQDRRGARDHDASIAARPSGQNDPMNLPNF